MKKFFLFIGVVICFFVFINNAWAKNEEVHEILVKYKDQSELKLLKVKDSNYKKEINQLKNNSQVEYFEPNHTYRLAIIPSDRHYEKLWYLPHIKANKAWDHVRETPSIVIAVIDSGIQINHPDLSANIWKNPKEIPGTGVDNDNNGYIDDYHGWDFVNNTPDPSPKFEEGFNEGGIMHGTIVAGIAAAAGNNGIGVSGITWNASIMALRVLDDKGEGRASDVIRAIDYAVNNGADIINLSFVGFDYSRGLYEAINRAYSAGVIVVAAAGNEQQAGQGYNLDEFPIYPACYRGPNNENIVIAVAATDTLDQKADFSSFGACVDIVAPGVSIFSTVVYDPDKEIDGFYLNKYYDGYWSGTSMAVPIISGTLALIQEANKSLSRNSVVDILFSSVDNIDRLNPDYFGKLGSGRVNVEKAVVNSLAQLKKINNYLLISPHSDRESVVSINSLSGKKISDFKAYDFFTGGVQVATGDVDGDGIAEIITGAGFGGGPHVRIFDKNGNLKSQFFAFSENFRGGVNVAVGDVDGNGIAEIITGAGFGGGPHVRVFDKNGNLKSQFFAFSENFRGGVNVAVGDVDGNGIAEIITGAGFGGGPQVRIFDKGGNLKSQFFAYNKEWRSGVKVAVADIDGGVANKKYEIVTAPGAGQIPEIRIFNDKAEVLKKFLAYNENFKGGFSIITGDVDNDGLDDIITGAGPGGSAHVRIFKSSGKFISSFFAYEESFRGGVNVSLINY